jgi:predicted transcriptional regulator of viral defense system
MKTKKLTIAEARAILRRIGYTLRVECGEYRINRKGRGEATAYYATDLEEAVGTARFEAAREAQQ